MDLTRIKIHYGRVACLRLIVRVLPDVPLSRSCIMPTDVIGFDIEKNRQSVSPFAANDPPGL